MNVIKTARNNWKKTIVISSIGGFGVYYARKKWNDWMLMRAYCLEAKKYGDAVLKGDRRPKRVTVFLNPAANGGSGRTSYEKHVAPLLNLAGIEVTLVKPRAVFGHSFSGTTDIELAQLCMTIEGQAKDKDEYEGQAKKYMDVLEDTDAILVAGGDGTLSEVVTGLLRRKDEAKFCKIPIGIIPLGKTNSLAKSLCPPEVTSTVQFIAEMAMSTIEGYTRPVDAFNVRGGEDKSVFAVAGMELGAFTDSEIRKQKNWYFGPLKHRLAYLVTSLRYWPPVCESSFSYVLPCDGCNRCFAPPVKPQWKWWHMFIPPRREVVTKDYSQVKNDSCGQVHSSDLSFVQMAVTTNQPTQNASTTQNSKHLTINITPDNISKTDFVKQGWRRLHQKKFPTENSENQIKFDAKEVTVDLKRLSSSDPWFLIDSEKYEVMNFSIKLLPDKLKFYCCNSIKINLEDKIYTRL